MVGGGWWWLKLGWEVLGREYSASIAGTRKSLVLYHICVLAMKIALNCRPYFRHICDFT